MKFLQFLLSVTFGFAVSHIELAAAHKDGYYVMADGTVSAVNPDYAVPPGGCPQYFSCYCSKGGYECGTSNGSVTGAYNGCLQYAEYYAAPGTCQAPFYCTSLAGVC